MWSLLATLVLVVVLWLYMKWRRVRSYWADRGVPHLPIHPLLGSLTFLQRENPGPYFRKLYDQYRVPYVGFWLFWRPALVINSPEIARRVLVKDADNFKNRLVGSGIAKTDPVGGLNLFCVNDPIWSSLRKNLTPVFTSSKLKNLNHLKLMKSKELLQRVANDLKENKEIEIRSMFADFTTDIIGGAAFGVMCDATLTGESPMRTVTKDFMEYGVYRGLSWVGIFFLPEIANFFRFKFFPNKSMAYFKKLYKTIVAQRGNETGANHKDLMEALLKMKQDAAKNDEYVIDDLILAQAVIFLQGGFDTTAVSLTYITYELSFHQEAQEKLYKELVEAKEKLGDAEFDSGVLSELPYLNAVVKEALRKYPPLGWLDRVAKEPYKIDDKLTIPAGTTIYVNAIGMQYDPQYYPEPDKFVPERFLNEKVNVSFTYMPFGEGPRNCIGKRFAYHTIWYALAALLLKYQFKPKPGSKIPSKLEMDKTALLAMPGEDVFVDFIPRD